jgi:AbiV family abortive infection protein
VPASSVGPGRRLLRRFSAPIYLTLPHRNGSPMSTFVTERFLLEGAAYALEQCGRLLHAANLLNKDGDWATAVAMASFAREELGRWDILLDLRREVLKGKQLTAKDVNEASNDHERKQKAGMTSITMRADRDSGLGKLLAARGNAKPGSPEWKQAQDQIDKLDRKLRQRTPGERHDQRMAALYVDAVSESEWNRPVTAVSAKQAWAFLTDAANDYDIQRERYTNLEILKALDLELHDALKAWTERSELPLVEAPPFVE